METHNLSYRAVGWRQRASGGYRLALATTLALAATLALLAGASPAEAAPGHSAASSHGVTAVPRTPAGPSLAMLRRAAADLQPPQRLEANDALPRPSWWSGSCDVGHNSIAVPLAASFDGLQTCGPGSDQSGENYLVRFFSGAWGEYEWQCVELSMRWMYMAWGAAPYGANGNSVVPNYPNGTAGYPTLAIVRNGTAGEPPQPGDVLSIDNDDEFGHTEVISSSAVDGGGNGTATAMTENGGAGSNGWATLTVKDWVVTDGDTEDTVVAWLHNPNWLLQEPVLWDLTTAGDLEIKDGDSLNGSFATVATGVAQADVIGGDRYAPTPMAVALTKTGELEGGDYLPGVPLGSIAKNVASFAVSAAPSADGHPVLAWVTTAGNLEVSDGSLVNPPVQEATGVAHVVLSPNSGPSDPFVGYLSTAGTFFDREGPASLNVGTPWIKVATHVTSIALAGGDLTKANAIEAYTSKGTFFARQGMTGAFTTEAKHVTQIAAASVGPQAEPLLAYVKGGNLAVAEGAVTAKSFTEQAAGVTSVVVAGAMSDMGFPIVGVIAGGEFEAEDGLLNKAWVKQASGLAAAGVAALTVS
jgi:hypothetical protein